MSASSSNVPRLATVLALAAFALVAAPAVAQVLYKWTDANGQTHYGDRVPKDFKGQVVRIEPEEPRTPAPPAPPAKASVPLPDKAVQQPTPPDPGAKRRATRLQLEARLARARDSVDAAKKALSDSDGPQDDERQVVQQRQAKGGMHGMAPRSNCRTEVGKDGRKVLMCPTSVPTGEYYDRIARLEANLRKAEEELADAEQAWRRGVD